MTHIERMRARQQVVQAPAKTAGDAGGAGATAPSPPPPKERPARHKAATHLFRCGHQSYPGDHCPACRSATQKARAERNSVKHEAKPQPDAQRLPDGAEFHVEYSARLMRWRGTLMIGPDVFVGEESAVFRLLRALDMQYRAWAKGKEQA